jgi:hypothetical protein
MPFFGSVDCTMPDEKIHHKNRHPETRAAIARMRAIAGKIAIKKIIIPNTVKEFVLTM